MAGDVACLGQFARPCTGPAGASAPCASRCGWASVLRHSAACSRASRAVSISVVCFSLSWALLHSNISEGCDLSINISRAGTQPRWRNQFNGRLADSYFAGSLPTNFTARPNPVLQLIVVLDA